MTAPLLLLLLVGALVWAAWDDLRRRIIPNPLNGAIALAAPLFWLAQGMAPWPDMAAQLGIAAAVFALFVGLFALGMMGGGDVKLIGGVALWLPRGQIVDLLVLTALAGGVVTLATLAWHRLRRKPGRPEVPYGVAIACAAITCIAANDIFTNFVDMSAG